MFPTKETFSQWDQSLFLHLILFTSFICLCFSPNTHKPLNPWGTRSAKLNTALHTSSRQMTRIRQTPWQFCRSVWRNHLDLCNTIRLKAAVAALWKAQTPRAAWRGCQQAACSPGRVEIPPGPGGGRTREKGSGVHAAGKAARHSYWSQTGDLEGIQVCRLFPADPLGSGEGASLKPWAAAPLWGVLHPTGNSGTRSSRL